MYEVNLQADWHDVGSHCNRISDLAGQLTLNAIDKDVLATLRVIDSLANTLVAVTQDVIEIAGRETTIPQKTLAEALGVNPRVLRGLRS
jgi:hypothetical protein